MIGHGLRVVRCKRGQQRIGTEDGAGFVLEDAQRGTDEIASDGVWVRPRPVAPAPSEIDGGGTERVVGAVGRVVQRGKQRGRQERGCVD